MISAEYKNQTGRSRKVTGLQLGYEARCARPHAFDVMLGSQLGVGAYRALVEEKLNGVMVSVAGQLDLNYVKFEELVDRETLVTKVRYVERAQPLAEVVGAPAGALLVKALLVKALANGDAVLPLIEAAIQQAVRADALAGRGVPIGKRRDRRRINNRGQIAPQLRIMADELVASRFASHACHVIFLSF